MAEFVKYGEGKQIDVLDIGPEQEDNCHGRHKKDGAVLHETVSPDVIGWDDIRSISSFLDNKDYGIHGIVDSEGHKAYAVKMGTCIFWHASSSGSKGTGMINTRKIGIELISTTPPSNLTRLQKIQWWLKRERELQHAAKLLACTARSLNFPLVYADPDEPGITTHWDVSQKYGVPGGHTDCWPSHKGGYFPILRLVRYANAWRALGY